MGGVGALRIRGHVLRAGRPVEGAYVTLNQGEEFIAERRTGPDGLFEFHATPGDWLLVCRAADTQAVRREVSGGAGELEADFEL